MFNHLLLLSDIALPAGWAVLPFVLLLLMIATGPLFYERLWQKCYPVVAIVLGAMVVFYYITTLKDSHQPVHALFEFISFMALIGSLFVVSSSISIYIHYEASPVSNVIFLIIGALLANVIGTAGASILLIKPFMRMNRFRLKPYLVVFFIFIVSNGGGCLTPIGDPPLFLGFLHGVPFFWTVQHLAMVWLVGIATLSGIFFFIDSRQQAIDYTPAVTNSMEQRIVVKGKAGFIWLAVIIGAVFIDPNVINGVPTLSIGGSSFSFIRELVMISVAILAYSFADKKQMKENDFSFEPLKEVGFLFLGIFVTMMPALQLVSHFAASENGMKLMNEHFLYWSSGSLSSVLDNAPTYLSFLAAGMGREGMNIASQTDVQSYSSLHSLGLIAVSAGSVFFGAMTYIGNAPNFMVRSIAIQQGVKMPSFFGYVLKYAIPFLLPVLVLIWILFIWL